VRKAYVFRHGKSLANHATATHVTSANGIGGFCRKFRIILILKPGLQLPLPPSIQTQYSSTVDYTLNTSCAQANFGKTGFVRNLYILNVQTWRRRRRRPLPVRTLASRHIDRRFDSVHQQFMFSTRPHYRRLLPFPTRQRPCTMRIVMIDCRRLHRRCTPTTCNKCRNICKHCPVCLLF
jgi:hypothetical protein